MYIELGKVVGVWGVKGWIKLHSYCRNRNDIANYSTWFLKSKNDDPVSYEVLNCREQGQGIAAQLAGVNDPDQAALLNGKGIFVLRDDLPKLPDGQFYWQELIGLNVVNADQEIGKVSSILETGANDVLVIKRAKQNDALIPYIDEVIKAVDLEQGTMQVDWDPAVLD